MTIDSIDEISPKGLAWHREILADRVDRSADCWLWLGSQNGDGYGMTSVDGRKMLVHRLVYILEKGDIPAGQLVRHICPGGGNRACVNPSHLILGSPSDNSRDTVDSGRFKKRGSVRMLPAGSRVGIETSPADEQIRRLGTGKQQRMPDWIADHIGLPRKHVRQVLASVRRADGTRTMTSFERTFWVRVQRSNTCWLWEGHLSSGYAGYVRFDTKRERAHRVAWTLHNGRIPPGKVICHNCPGGDNSVCVNPKHLFVGTQKDNMLDRARKANFGFLKSEDSLFSHSDPVPNHKTTYRGPLGEASKTAKLTEADVRSIRRLFAEGRTYESLAQQFGVSSATIGCAVQRKSWKHVI